MWVTNIASEEIGVSTYNSRDTKNTTPAKPIYFLPVGGANIKVECGGLDGGGCKIRVTSTATTASANATGELTGVFANNTELDCDVYSCTPQ